MVQHKTQSLIKVIPDNGQKQLQLHVLIVASLPKNKSKIPCSHCSSIIIIKNSKWVDRNYTVLTKLQEVIVFFFTLFIVKDKKYVKDQNYMYRIVPNTNPFPTSVNVGQHAFVRAARSSKVAPEATYLPRWRPNVIYDNISQHTGTS